MEDIKCSSQTTLDDPESPYSPLLDPPNKNQIHNSQPVQKRPLKGFAIILLSILFLASLIVVILDDQNPANSQTKVDPRKPSNAVDQKATPFLPEPGTRGVSAGVSEKTFRTVSDDDGGDPYPWNSVELRWQRTAYHFQPEKNWMNDPNGPLYHEGWYHLFYQYNPDSAVWGNITWGHAVSADMIHWLYLPIAMRPDSWFDWNGVWTGSATLLPDGRIVILYTGDTDNYVQVQNYAYPANLSDPLLLYWVKYAGNPVMTPPEFIALKDFRDPTTAWLGPDGLWRVALGSKLNKTGIALVYATSNFTTFELLDGVLHAVPTTGMWECVDFYPISTMGIVGLDTSANGPGIKHVLKASLDDTKHDYYAIGTYDLFNNTWTPDNPEQDVGIGLRVDYGKYYASKTFYDQNKGRRILWGWTGETDSEAADLQKGWASVQSIPRIVIYDNKTGTNIIQWPIEEVESLRLNSTEFDDVELEPGSVVELDVGRATQLDIIAEFDMESEALEATLEADASYNCSGSGGSAQRGSLGPFGLLVIANENLTERTPYYFYIAKASDGNYTTFFCSDQTRSSLAPDVGHQIYGSTVPVLDGEKFTMRLLVDHSIVEGFAQGGRRVITSRIYPTEAIYGAAKAYLFNNATGANVTASLKVWQMDSAYIHPFPLHQI